MFNKYMFRDVIPHIHDTAFIAPSADIIGRVEIGERSNVWYQCVIRGDVNKIIIGSDTNIQDGTVVHVDREKEGEQSMVGATTIGDRVTIGHNCMIHACELQDECFVGMSATVMSNAVVETHSMLAAGALLLEGRVVPSGQLWGGSPAKYLRDLTEKEIEHIRVSADNYVKLSLMY